MENNREGVMRAEGHSNEEKNHSYAATQCGFSQQERAKLMFHLARDKDPTEDLGTHVSCNLEQNRMNVAS